MTTWFTSDFHFGHFNIIRYCNRPFEDTDTMNRVLIENYNSVVKNDDEVWILGDIAMNWRYANELVPLLKGRKHLVIGNHDRLSKIDVSMFQSVDQYANISVGVYGKNYNVFLCHYPMVEWNKSQHGSMHLHGHQHNSFEYNEEQRRMGILRYDVGVDANQMFPVSMEQIVSFFGI